MTEATSHEAQRGHSFDSLELSNLSSIDRASFLNTVQSSYGNPLHSTALEEDLLLTDMGGGKKKDAIQIRKTATSKGKGASVHRRKTGTDKDKARGRGTTGESVNARPIETLLDRPGKVDRKKGKVGAAEKERKSIEGETLHSNPRRKSGLPVPSSNVQIEDGVRCLAGSKATQKRSVGQKSAARAMNRGGPEKEKKRRRQSESRKVNRNQAQQGKSVMAGEGSESDGDQQNDQSSLSEENPSQKEARVHSLGRLSSASGSAKPNLISRNKEKRRRIHGQKAGTQWEVVLDSFLEFCLQYKESVGSKLVKQTIDSFISSVKVQLMEKITVSKEFRLLKRDNTKLNSLIVQKRQRLLDAKYELIRTEQQLLSQQKEEAKLKLRLADLRRGQAFLHNITQLNKRYLKHQQAHPKQKLKYGASSLPALLLETKCILGAEDQLKEVNKRLERALEQFKE